MIGFYEREMGLRTYFRSDECAFLRAPNGRGAALALYERTAGANLPIFAVDVTDLESFMVQPGRVNTRSATINSVPGGRILKLADPDGNPVELHEQRSS